MASSTTATAKWTSDLTFQTTSSTGNVVMLDAKLLSEGEGNGPTPMEAVLQALAACSGMTVASILRNRMDAVSSYAVAVDADRTAKHPKVFTAIRIAHAITGRNLEVALIKRAIELAETTFCPVAAILRASARLDVTYRIVDEATGQEHEGRLEVAPEPAG